MTASSSGSMGQWMLQCKPVGSCLSLLTADAVRLLCDQDPDQVLMFDLAFMTQADLNGHPLLRVHVLV